MRVMLGFGLFADQWFTRVTPKPTTQPTPQTAMALGFRRNTAAQLTAPAGSRYLFDNVASRDKRLEIYPGLFHEIYNEPERDTVLDDLIGWFDAHVAA